MHQYLTRCSTIFLSLSLIHFFLMCEMNKKLSYYGMKNDICTTILVQLLYNFLSYSHYVFILSLPLSLSLSLSLLFLTNEKREQQSCLKGCTKMVVKISPLLWNGGSILYDICFYIERFRWSSVYQNQNTC